MSTASRHSVQPRLAPSLETLPDELLDDIFVQLGQHDLPTSPLSKRVWPFQRARRWAVISIDDAVRLGRFCASATKGSESLAVVKSLRVDLAYERHYGGDYIRLQKLDVGRNDFLRLLKAMRSLEVLECKGVRHLAELVHSPEVAMSHLPALRSFETDAAITAGWTHALHPVYFHALAYYPNLRHLTYTADRPAGVASEPPFVAHKPIPQALFLPLTSLKLDGPLSASGATSAILSGMPNLTHLSLWDGTDIPSQDPQSDLAPLLRALPNPPLLTNLALSAFDLVHVPALAQAVSSLTSLTHLELGGDLATLPSALLVEFGRLPLLRLTFSHLAPIDFNQLASLLLPPTPHPTLRDLVLDFVPARVRGPSIVRADGNLDICKDGDRGLSLGIWNGPMWQYVHNDGDGEAVRAALCDFLAVMRASSAVRVMGTALQALEDDEAYEREERILSGFAEATAREEKPATLEQLKKLGYFVDNFRRTASLASEMTGLVPGHRLFLLFAVQGPLEDFRNAEIESICSLLNIDFSWPTPPDSSRPYVLIGLRDEEAARQLGTRLVSVKHIWEFWAQAEAYEELHAKVKSAELREIWEPYTLDRDCTWKFTVAGHNRTIALKEQVELINTFSYMPFPGDIDLRKPKLEIGVFEEYEFDRLKKLPPTYFADVKGKAPAGAANPPLVGTETAPVAAEDEEGKLLPMRAVWMGRKICETQRHLIDIYDVKKRAYIGTTTMEAEASLLMANQAQAAPGKFVYDPFAGTGSMLLTAAHFGAFAFGSDIDGRQMRGKKTSIRNSAEQYGVKGRIVDCCSFDMTQHPWRTGEFFDAIVTDPPYGVRAGAKRLGRQEGEKEILPMVVKGRESEGVHTEFHDYVPPSVGWPMEEVISTLVTFSLYLLKPGGRLVFFLPTDNAEYSDVDIPSIPGLKLISNSSQSFGKWARRLITMEKEEGDVWRKAVEGLDRGIRRKGQKSALEIEREEQGGEAREEKKPGHADFRERYYEGFTAVKEGVKKLLLGEGEDKEGAQ
ncbi:hypothetical protein JCM8097_001017 [Rhodosporidiobolus ruineniae]